MNDAFSPLTGKAERAVTLDDVRRAAAQIEGQIVRTPTIPAPKLSAITGANVYLKYETMQLTGAFKERGALAKLLSLPDLVRARGVIAMSAGNHAQAVAYHAGRLGVPSVIVMPETTPFVKVGNTEALGAEVVLAGDGFADARARAEELAEERELVLIHPYDDANVIAGQGTIALEVLEDHPLIDMFVVPVGGGGLASGIAVAAKGINANIELIGVQTATYPSMRAALEGRDAICGGTTLADGIAVKTSGALTLPIVRRLVSDIMIVDESAIEAAICLLLSLQKTVAEGAGAAPLAAMLASPERFAGRNVCLIVSGGNIDPRILASIVMRGLERDSKIVSLRLKTADQPGVLGKIATRLGKSGANILEVSHRRTMLDVSARGAFLDLVIETRDASHTRRVIAELTEDGFDIATLPEVYAS